MACSNIGCLCNHLVFSQSVSFTDNTLTVNIPAGSYENGEKYCIVIAQEIPTTTTIGSDVVITIGDDTTEYPLVNSNCTNINAYQLSTRTRYATRVYTNIQSGVFKLLGNLNCYSCRCRSNAAPSLPIPTTSTTTTGADDNG